MSIEEIQALLRRFSYKPGWRFEIVSNTFAPHLQISFEEIDTYHPDRKAKIGFREPLRPEHHYPNEEHFLRWLLDSIDKVEKHETREWFKVDGIMIFDPHING